MNNSALKSDEDISYLRPPVKPMFSSDPLIFMQTDVDYTLMANNEPIVRIFGVTEFGNSVLLLVHNFEPYFYAQLPSNLPMDSDTKNELINVLSVNLLANNRQKMIVK